MKTGEAIAAFAGRRMRYSCILSRGTSRTRAEVMATDTMTGELWRLETGRGPAGDAIALEVSRALATAYARGLADGAEDRG